MGRSRPKVWAGRVLHGLALLLALSAAALAAAALDVHPGAAVAFLLAAVALAGYLLRTLAQRRLLDEMSRRAEFAATLLQSMNEAVMVLDANHRVIDVNRRWRELTGHDTDRPLPLEPPPLPPPAGGDWLMPRVDGTHVPVLATLAPIPDEHGAARGYVATYVDIAGRKRAEEALADRAAELERGNGLLSEANARLATALTVKNDLTSMLTHDVAQPISSIASLAELLCADWTDLPDDTRFELATKIDKNAHRLIKMMNDLQLLFRLDTGAVTARRAPVPVLEVVLAVTTTEDDVAVEVDEDLAVLADREHLTVVMQNLVGNALAYGAMPVVVSAARRGETVAVTVQDNGPGIAEEQLPNLFGRFTRGTGLGLFIVRHLVEANGGSVTYEQVRPGGARFTVTWEAAPV
jgi:signal transduction histidine kinase